jgi:hypothetical protein
MDRCVKRWASSPSKAICAVKTTMNIKRLMDLGCYRGVRHRRGLPLARPAYPYQRTYPQGAAQGDLRRQEVTRLTGHDHGQSRNQSSQESQEERGRRHRPRSRFFQQHDHHDHRSPGQRPVVGDVWWRRLQGFAQERRRSPRRLQQRRPARLPSNVVSRIWKSASRAPALGANRRYARSMRSA